MTGKSTIENKMIGKRATESKQENKRQESYKSLIQKYLKLEKMTAQFGI